MRFLRNLSIRVKAFGASLVLLLCLIGIGGNAYLTSDRAATDLVGLTGVNLPKQQTVAKLENDITAIHLGVFRYVSWASNSVSAALLNALSAETREGLLATKKRIRTIAGRPDLSPVERQLIAAIAAHWDKYAAAARDTLDVGRTDAPMATMMLGGVDDDFKKVEAALETLSAFVDGQTAAIGEALADNAENNKRILAYGGAAGILFSILVTLLVSRSIVSPIRHITRAMQHVSSEKFDLDVGYMDRGDEVGQMVRAIAAYRDWLRTQNLRFDAALNNMPHGLAMFDGAQCLVVSNKRYAEMYGLSPEQVQPGTSLRSIVERRVANGIYAGPSVADHLHERSATLSAPSIRIQELSDGRSVVIARQPMADGGWVTTHEDITERRRAESQIAHMATHDALTDLPNRLMLRESLEQALTRVKRGELVALFYVDLDHFKAVNDTLGHLVGDELLKQVAERLRGCVREIDTIARLGGDEFAIIQTALVRPNDAALLAQRVQAAVKAPYVIDGNHVVIDTSMGIALAPDDGASVEELLKNADLAAYAAKADGRGTFRFFEQEMDRRIKERRVMELDLREALARREFRLHYQPIINMQSGEITSFEALIRWQHPERGLVAPADFIPLAEDLGLIVPIGEWVINQACADAVTWSEQIKVAVNLSPVQLLNKGLVEVVTLALAQSGLSAHRLEFEITETVLMHNTAATLATLHQLRALGIHFSMDDFGTGYSSLSYLRSFPFDKIKIDRSFVTDISDEKNSLAIIKGVTSLATSLNMITAVEGVETEEQLDHVRPLGCTEMQGYLFSRPRALEEIIRLFPAKTEKATSAA
ncbi:MAG TPA: EAL domain-containing protein [Xanthobacteraceae bacterium]|nr:EAL domain-containing protein [Xanthobacteraceae bacterium]